MPDVRSLADDLRARSADQLVALVLARPDLARPTPADLTALATRASTRSSIQRAVEHLDRGAVHVLEAVLVLGEGSDAAQIAALLGDDADPAQIASIVEMLWRTALVWRSPAGIHPVRTLTDVLGRHPAGVGPSLLSLRGSLPTSWSQGGLEALLHDMPPAARAIVDKLTWGPPTGRVGQDRDVSEGVRWLLTRHLVVATAADTVTLPREVALVLRGHRLHRASALTAPQVGGQEVSPRLVSAAAGGQGAETLARVSELLMLWAQEAPRVLRSGGVAVRDLRRTASALDLAETDAALLIEVAHEAGLVADDGELSPSWTLTASYDEWAALAPAERLAALTRAWLMAPRALHLLGPDASRSGSRRAASRTSAPTVLGADLGWPGIRALRRDVLVELAELPPGLAADRDQLTHRLAWRRPMRDARLVEAALDQLLREFAALGLIGCGALCETGRAAADLLTAQGDSLARSYTAVLPPPVDHILVQADLTAVAPGPLEGDLAELMRASSDVESRGGATVHRFTEGSIRRALGAGWTADALMQALSAHSRTPLPQPLAYLICDVARRHGRTRIGLAGAYIRSDDPAALESLLATPGTSLRRLAPTVLVSPLDPAALAEAVRDAGGAPAIERPDGSLVSTTTDARRVRRRRPNPPSISLVDEGHARQLITGLLALDDVRGDLADAPELPWTDPTTTATVLRDAAADGRAVWLGYSDQQGRTSRFLFYPIQVDAGRVSGRADLDTTMRTLWVHRITGVAEL